jgi:hypothetical protein
MSLAEKQALALRDLALRVVMAKGVVTASDSYSYHDDRLRVEYFSGKPQALDVYKRGDIGSRDAKVLGVIWNDGGDAVVVLHRGGSWETSLKRLAKVWSVSDPRLSWRGHRESFAKSVAPEPHSAIWICHVAAGDPAS